MEGGDNSEREEKTSWWKMHIVETKIIPQLELLVMSRGVIN